MVATSAANMIHVPMMTLIVCIEFSLSVEFESTYIIMYSINDAEFIVYKIVYGCETHVELINKCINDTRSQYVESVAPLDPRRQKTRRALNHFAPRIKGILTTQPITPP